MQALKQQGRLRPRELRRRVMLPARLCVGSQWTDTCILNVSTHGLMIQTGQTAQKGALIEIRRDRHVITGRVMWRDGGRAGVRCENPLPVEEILSLGTSKSLRLVAEDGALLERRYSPRRRQVDARLRGRALQFAGVVAMILALSIAGAFWVREAFATPLQAIEAALGS